MTVITVLGEIEESELGVVLPHEHLIANGTMQWAKPQDPDELLASLQPLSPADRVRSQMAPFHYRSVLSSLDPLEAIDGLRSFREAGGKTVVDLSPPAFGRDPVALKAIAELSGLNVVMGCGEYVESAHSQYVAVCSIGQIRDSLISEIVEGVGNTGIRAGIIGEIGSGNPVTAAEEKVLRAAAQAQLATGVALNIHRSVFPDPLAGIDALRIVLDEGVDPTRVVMSHCDERPEPEFSLEVGRSGAFIELDTFGMEHWAANCIQKGELVRRSFDSDRVDLVKTIAEAGHIKQLLISQDVAMKTQRLTYGGAGYAHISTNIEPILLQEGFTPEEIAGIRVDNPRRMLCISH
jgi:phosphotriesterase-related protein